MKLLRCVLLPTVFVIVALVAPLGQAQTDAQKTPSSPEAEVRKENVQAYIDLLRTNVRQQKAEIMGAMMALSAADAASSGPFTANMTRNWLS